MQNMFLDIHVFPHDVHWQPPHAGGGHAQAATARSVRRESGKLPRTESRRRRRAAINAANARRSRCPHLCEAGPPCLPASGPARLIQIMTVGASRTSRRVRDGCPWRQLDTRLPAARRYRRTRRDTTHNARRIFEAIVWRYVHSARFIEVPLPVNARLRAQNAAAYLGFSVRRFHPRR